jgi:DNA repair exonuclease SbcCD nuclease subunit
MLVGDVHLSDRPPSIRTDDYTNDIFAKLLFIGEKAKDLQCDAIALLGDVFHIKAPSRTSHALVQQAVEVFKDSGLPVIVVPGNHDMSNDRIESLSKQPLGTLCKADGIDMLMGGHETLPVFAIPYLHDWPGQLKVWMSKFEKWRDEKKFSKDSTDWHFNPLVITHAPIFPVGEEPPYDFIGADDWAAVQQVGDVAYGHIHDPHGSYKVGNVWFNNQGAISRGSLHEKTLKRKPACTVWDSETFETLTGRFRRIEIPHRPVEAVFRIAAKEDVDARQERVADFLAGVATTELDGLTTEEVLAYAKSMELKPGTLAEIEACIEYAQTN